VLLLAESKLEFQVMLDEAKEVPKILMNKQPSKYTSHELDAVNAIASASEKRSLADFNIVS